MSEQIPVKITRHQEQFKFLILLCMLYSATLLLSGLYTYRPILLDGYSFAASSLIYPLSYPLNDIICEVYGYQYSRKLIWFGLMAVFFFAFVTKLFDGLPYPTSFKNQSAYLDVLNPYLRLSCAGLVSMAVGEFTNITIMSKWKTALQGRYFWLRSFCSTSFGSAIDTLAEYMVAFLGVVAFSKIIEMLLFAYFFRVIYALVMATPSAIIVSILKKVEKAEEFKPVISYNPFSLQND